ncbi:MAG TPA: GNAT family N-acetyltransferase [Propionibacteriaceae bacterium]
MAHDSAPGTAPAGPWPDGVPALADPAGGITLRAHRRTDQPDMIEACNDPEVVRWSTVPIPEGGYSSAEAEEYYRIVRAGWASGERLSWAIEGEFEGRRRFCGSIDLRVDGRQGEVGYLLHPAARGRSMMSTALRLVRDHAFEVVGLEAIHWRAVVGNWSSRRVAAAAGFVFDGTVRRCLDHRGELLDGWQATITRDDPRAPLPWLDPPRLTGPRAVLRPFSETDADRVVQACTDPRTRHWLVSMPQPYTHHDALDYIELTRELAARRSGLAWCIADPHDDRCLGSISLEGFGGYSRRAEIGYWAHPSARGLGVVTAAVRLVTAYAEEVGLVDSIVIRCAAGNTASRHVAEGSGYTQAGVLPASEPLGDGELADLISYSRP